MLLNDHAGMYGPGDVEPGTDERSTWLADLRAERAEEIAWVSDRVVERTGLPVSMVREVLCVRDAVIAEADSEL
jgi:hypothetical protein